MQQVHITHISRRFHHGRETPLLARDEQKASNLETTIFDERKAYTALGEDAEICAEADVY